MKIQKVVIKNFKCFKNFKIKLNDFSIIVGDNGIGKSTLLEAIHLALTGYYRGKNISSNISQDLFNKEVVDEYISDFHEGKNPNLPIVSIEIFFDEYALFNGDNNSTHSGYDGFSFRILYDERNDEAYKEFSEKKEIKSLPIEFYKYEWNTFSRKIYTNAKSINFKSAFLDTENNKYSNSYSTRLIKNYVDDFNRFELNQSFREMTENLKSANSFKRINDRIIESDNLKSRNISIGLVNSAQDAWENIITIQENNIPYENIGTGKQCLINTILSFANDFFINKGIILIEEPENHLSGMNLNVLLKYIKEHAEGHQVIITTHSSYVLNKLGMDNLFLMGDNDPIKLSKLPQDTAHYFEKLSGFDTLRFILCKKAFLVEGDSDNLILQRAYLDKYDKLPIEDGIEIINTSLSYCRFLDLASELNIKTIVLTDNDSNLNRINEIKNKYKNYKNIKIFSGEKVYVHKDTEISKEKVPNLNTLEPEILRANNRDIMNKVLDTNYSNDGDLLHYMISNKTECAWKIFSSKLKIQYPAYIIKAIENENAENE